MPVSPRPRPTASRPAPNAPRKTAAPARQPAARTAAAPPTPAPPVLRSDARRAAWIVAVIAVVIAVPVGIVSSLGWLDLGSHWAQGGRVAPQWLEPAPVRATTRDGTLVKLRVAFDVGSGATRSAVQRQLRDVGLLVEVSIGAQSTGELMGPRGLQLLSRDILARINAFLATQGVDPMRSVAIQDFWYSRP